MSEKAAHLHGLGYRSAPHGIFLKPVLRGRLDLWVAWNVQKHGETLNQGCLLPDVNRFALRLLRPHLGERSRVAGPAYAIPPLVVENAHFSSEGFSMEQFKALMADFEATALPRSVESWVNLTERLFPYGQAQSVILPAWYYLTDRKEQLNSWLAGRSPHHPIAEAEAYLGDIATLANIPLPDATGRWEPPPWRA